MNADFKTALEGGEISYAPPVTSSNTITKSEDNEKD